MAVSAVPVFWTTMDPGVVAQLEVLRLADTDTWAELVNDPRRPKTNPEIAMAAIRVIAISMTVARTGLMAFLRLLFGNLTSKAWCYWRVPLNWICRIRRTLRIGIPRSRKNGTFH
jgi:hypothetical protein